MIVSDVLDPARSARWWASTVGGVAEDHDVWALVRLPEGAGGLPLAFQRVSTPTPGKNRVHLDIGVDDEAIAVRELVARGATVVEEVVLGEGVRWTVMDDPDGLRFCVAAHAAG